MPTVNIIVLEGRIIKAPEQTITKSGKPICRFQIDNNRYFYQGIQSTEVPKSFNAIARDALAERCANLKRGTLVLISGKLKSINSYKSENCIEVVNLKILSKTSNNISERVPICQQH